MSRIEYFLKGYTRGCLGCIVATCVFLSSISVFAAEPIRGIYGVPSIKNVDPSSYVGKMEKAGVNAVFVPPEKETIQWFKTRGFRVFLSVNAFGGKGAWKKYPDSRPIKADGSPLGSEPEYKGHGGVCPTHPEWRNERLKYIKKLVNEFGGESGIDPPASPERASGSRRRAGGIWLDFIRYPGLWEAPEPEIPDTCYCPRCLAKFQQDTGVKIPSGLDTKGSAAWIKENCPYRWMVWKKEQIASFVSEVRDVMKKNSGRRLLKLGLFLVPWTKGERGDAISYLLAQDPFQLSGLVDVISPMVYHKMCGRSEEWVGYMTQYYKETVSSQVWPIVQSVDCKAGEFRAVMKYAGQGGADGVLVYSFKGMRMGFWERLGEFEVLPDFLANSLTQRRKDAKERVNGYSLVVSGEEKNRLDQDSRITNQPITNNFSPEVGVTAKDEWGEEWVVPLADCEPGAEYVFKGDLFRKGWRNGVYPSVSIWGEEFLVDTHLKAKVFQPVRVNVTCPNKVSDPFFRFINRNRNTTFWLTWPSLKRNYRFKPEPAISKEKWFFPGRFFPIGVYGADLENLEQIKKLAINTVILGGSGDGLREKVMKCHEVGLRYVLSASRDPDRLPPYLSALSEYVRPYDLAFYVNDEPGIWSFPVNQADDVNRLIKDRFPGAATCMAVVRPQVCRDFRWAADFFMLDQYPVPYMPMTWLSDSMDQAREQIRGQRSVVSGRKSTEDRGQGAGTESQITNTQITNNSAKRIASVIQAFGGEKYAQVGWPRLPTWHEMDCLAFLSVVHGSRGVFFFTFGAMGKTAEGRKNLGRVVGRFNRLYPWLIEENLEQGVTVEMVSSNRVDPKGRPAVHCCLKRKGNDLMVIAVNTIGTGVEALLGVEDERVRRLEVKKRRGVQEVFSGHEYQLIDGKLKVKFGPYETKAFLIREGEKRRR